MSDARPPRDSLKDMLQIEPGSGSTYSARLESFWGDAVPGDLLARVVLAGCAEMSASPSSLHADFFAPVAADVAIGLETTPRTDTTLRVQTSDGPTPLCDASLSFDGFPSDGLGYQSIAPEPGLPRPEDLPSEREVAEQEGWLQYAVGPIEARRVGEMAPVKDDEPSLWLGWLKPREPLADDERVHAAALAFLAEYRSHWAVERRLGAEFASSEVRLRNFALWVHRPERWEDWWLVRTLSDIGVGGRCLSRREIHTRDGALVASAAWEARVTTRS